MIHGKQYHSIIYKIFDHDVKNYLEGEQVQVNCPKCQEKDNLAQPDGKYNLEINTKKEVFRCWKCDTPVFSGSLAKLIKIYGSYSDYEIFKSYGGGSLINAFSGDDEEDYDDDYEIVMPLPQEYVPFSKMNNLDNEHMKAYMYMVETRKVSRETLLKYDVGFCTEGYYKNRIIIPSYNENDEVNYFVSRSYLEGGKPTYLNPKVDKDRIIFNEKHINWDSPLFIIEGAFDMFALINGVPQLGKIISKKLLRRLKDRKPHIVIVLDPDAYRNAIEMFQLLSAVYGVDSDRIKIVKLRGKYDLDEIKKNYGKEKVLEMLYTATDITVDDYFNMRNYRYANKGSKRSYRSYTKNKTW